MYQVKNLNTQPINDFPIFNNWNEVALGWYYVLPSHELRPKEVKAMQICGQEIVIFRGEDGKVGALDAYCPHMGTHLGRGKVVNNNVQCFFHHWQFDKDGSCKHIPCQSEIPGKAKVPSYAVCERFGSIWIYPASEAKTSFANFVEFEDGADLKIVFDKAYERSCHHHVTMINGIDPQHLKTVHNLDIEMQVDIAEQTDGKMIDIVLTGKIGEGQLLEKIARFFLGNTYSYAMRYDHGNNGFLTLMKDVHFKGWRWPSLHMIFAYRPLEKGRLLVQPIFVTKKRKGLLGAVKSSILIWMTKRAFHSLQGEDGAVYDNMRFYPGNLLSIDRPIAQYIQYVNKLEPSVWKLP